MLGTFRHGPATPFTDVQIRYDVSSPSRSMVAAIVQTRRCFDDNMMPSNAVSSQGLRS